MKPEDKDIHELREDVRRYDRLDDRKSVIHLLGVFLLLGDWKEVFHVAHE